MRLLFVAALKNEVEGLLEKAGAAVLYTGIGKVNATYHLTKSIYEARAQGGNFDLIINVGTAGSPTFPTHTLVECVQFFQRDMDLRPLGFQLGETPFDSISGEVTVEKRFTELPSARCGSGDRFEIFGATVGCEIIDMEAFALAKLCLIEKIPFASVKYVTDGSDYNAHDDWAKNIPPGAKAFEKFYERLLTRS